MSAAPMNRMREEGFPVPAGGRAQLPDTAGEEFDIILQPLTHPEVGEIRIAEELFAVGRNEPPFSSYPPEMAIDLSRRHARIFSEAGAVYVADLGSKNGTSVNGVDVREKTARLRQDDEICFGRSLCYRVRLGARSDTVGRAPKLASLTLTPERNDLGLQPIVIAQFPFLVSKGDKTFSMYKDAYPHQLNYLSRRHAHLFLKSGLPFVEDLGSTNGTFVSGKRLAEHAAPLKDGDVLAFGGHHFVYRVSIQCKAAEPDPTVTKLIAAVPEAAPDAGKQPARAPPATGRQAPASAAPPQPPEPGAAPVADAGPGDKTTFVAAADSFLDIFCVDRSPPPEPEPRSDEATRSVPGARDGGQGRRSRARIFLAELAQAFAGENPGAMKRPLLLAGAGGLGLLALVTALYVGSASESDIKQLLADDRPAEAAALASRYLERNPGNAEVKALATEAILKATVPGWLARLRARDDAGAAAAIAAMKQLGRQNEDALALIGELAWMGELDRFVTGRGGPDAPIRIYADEDRIAAFLKHWNEDTQAHQRAFSRIAGIVPAFRDPYADMLTRLRRLQSDDSVYFAAIGRLKAAIDADIRGEQPETLDTMLQDYAEKYPRLAGLDAVRQDARRYRETVNELRARNLARLAPLVTGAKFATPQFQAGFAALSAGRSMPSTELLRQYDAAERAWRTGDARQALAGLQAIQAGAWADVVAREIQHKQEVLARFGELQKRRDAAGHDDRLLAFYGMLDPAADVHFAKAVESDIAAYRGKALKRAQELMNRAQAAWTRYRDAGAIAGQQRLESGISNDFRAQARLLADAYRDAQQGMRIFTQLKAEHPVQFTKLRDDISTEAATQRRSLLELHRVLEPELLKAKLALLGEQNGAAEK
jgi:pSer/pThr/pTyr-binding forkhead associated (FHA) protein